MSRLGLLVFFLIGSSLLPGQPAWNFVTVTASRTADLPYDQLAFTVTLRCGIDKTFDEVVSLLQPAGITAANFQTINATFDGSQTSASTAQVDWQFQLAVPVSKQKDTIASLSRLRANLAQNKSDVSLSYSASATQVSPSPRDCSLSDLVADARGQAQKLAGAAGFAPGAILAIASRDASACSLDVSFTLGATFAQTTPNTITVGVSRNLTLQPDQVSFQLSLYSGLDAGPDEVTAALQKAGITGATISGVYQQTYGTQSQLQWYINVKAPLANVKTVFASLFAAQKELAGNQPSLSLYNAVGNAQVSTEQQKSQTCSDADLLSDARAQAQKLATAAGVSVGAVLALSNSRNVSYAPVGYVIPAWRQLGSFLLGPAPTSPSLCERTVQFQLLHN